MSELTRARVQTALSWSTWRPHVVILMIVSAVLGIAAAATVTPGLPYDEPAHWANVQFFAEHWRLPVLGEPGVGYQGQQTPLYYVMAAAASTVAGDAGFVVARLLGVVGLVVLVFLTALILDAIAPQKPLLTVAGAAFIALNPMLVVMSASVQNDTWALAWGFAAIVVAVRLDDRRLSPVWRGVLIGVLASLAILTKLSMAPLLIGLVIALLWRRRIWEPLIAVAVTGAAVGWWVVRNLLLYGDLTGQSAVGLTGANFENTGFSAFRAARSVLTFLTLPTEYVRNSIEAPTWVDAMAIVIGVVIVTGLVLLVWRRGRGMRTWPLAVVVLVAVVSMAAWILQVAFGWPVSFRTAYASLPLWALGAAMATQLTGRRVLSIGVLALTSVLQVVTLAWSLAAIAALASESMLWG